MEGESKPVKELPQWFSNAWIVASAILALMKDWELMSGKTTRWSILIFPLGMLLYALALSSQSRGHWYRVGVVAGAVLTCAGAVAELLNW